MGGRGGNEQYQCSDELKNFYTKRLEFDDSFITPEITAYEVVNTYPVLATKTPVVVMELIIK